MRYAGSVLALLPHIGGLCNLIITALIVGAYVAIRRGDRELHPKLMKAAIGLGAVFLVSYLVQITFSGHAEAPGEGWVRSGFLLLLFTHSVAAVAALPLILRGAYLGIRGRLDEHRRVVRFAYPVWLYVGVTGVVIYLMVYQIYA